MTFFMLSWFNLKYFWELVKIAIIAVFCKITGRMWILMHGMNPAILFLVFFIYQNKKEIQKISKKKNFFFFFFFFFKFFLLRFYKNNKIEFTAKVREGETYIIKLSMKKHNFECTVMMRQNEATVFIYALEYYCF